MELQRESYEFGAGWLSGRAYRFWRGFWWDQYFSWHQFIFAQVGINEARRDQEKEGRGEFLSRLARVVRIR